MKYDSIALAYATTKQIIGTTFLLEESTILTEEQIILNENRVTFLKQQYKDSIDTDFDTLAKHPMR